jgi:hypothetical protein
MAASHLQELFRACETAEQRTIPASKAGCTTRRDDEKLVE